MGDGFTVPTDWTEEDGYTLCLVCCPNSFQWKVNVQSAIYLLTRARAYDFGTGYWKGIEDQAIDVWESFMSCDIQVLIDNVGELVKTQRMIALALTGGTINFETSPNVPTEVTYEGLSTIIKNLGISQGTGITIGELITLMEAEDNSLYQFKDFLELLKIIRQITDDGNSMPLSLALNLWGVINGARTAHNGLTVGAYLATGIRGIQSALVPFAEGSQTPSEQETVQEVYNNLDKGNWLLTQVPSMLPSIPSITDFASRISSSSASWLGNLQSVLSTFWDRLTSEEPTPIATITPTGQLAQISKKLLDLDDNSDHTGLTISDRLEAIRAELSATGSNDLEPVLEAIDHILGGTFEPVGGP